MVLWCPDWPVSAAIQESQELDARRPIALIQKGEVFACSSSARLEGVRRGLRLREAQARCTQLQLVNYDPNHDLRAFQPVLAAIEQIMPGAQLLRPGTCAIRAKGPARYFGSEHQAAEVLRDSVLGLGVQQALVGIADGIFAAEQAARKSNDIRIVQPEASADFLSRLPLSVLQQPDLVSLLQRLGLETLGDFAALTANKVRSRFGEDGARAHLLARGLDSRTVVPQAPPPELDVVVDFEPALSRVDQLAFAIKTSAERFIDGISEEGLVCTAVRIRLESDSGEHLERVWKHPRFFDAEDVLDRVRWQLQGRAGTGPELDAELSSGITKVLLSPESTADGGSHAQGLWGNGPQERVHHGLSRIQSMVGHGAVLTAVLAGGRMLAQRSVLIPWGDSPPRELRELERERARPWPGSLPGPAPATLFDDPPTVQVLDTEGRTIEVDERLELSGRPAFFTPPIQASRAEAQRLINAWAGPWPVDERWWESSSQSLHRFQLVDSTDAAWLLFCRNGQWLAEASYD